MPGGMVYLCTVSIRYMHEAGNMAQCMQVILVWKGCVTLSKPGAAGTLWCWGAGKHVQTMD